MSRINEKMGLKPAGARKRLQSLSGVSCELCPSRDVRSNVIHGVLTWSCAFCGHAWKPSDLEVEHYNNRVRGRDRLEP